MPLYPLKLPPAPLKIGLIGTHPDPEEDEALKPAPRMAQPAQVQTLKQPHVPSLPSQSSQAAQMVKRYTDPAERRRASAWLRSQIPQNTTQQHPPPAPAAAAPPPSAAWTQPAQRSPASPRPLYQPQRQDLSRPINASTVPQTAPPAHPAASLPPPDFTRSAIPQNTTSDAKRVEMARRSGAVIEGSKLVPHPDGKGGMLHHTGFVQAFDPNAPQKPASYLYRNHPELGTTFHYRDDHGSQHPIPVQDIRRVADASGKVNYHFNVNGKPVAVPEGDKPLFQVDTTNGKRFTQAADGSRLDIGSDPNAAAQAAIPPREAAALKSRDDKLARGTELSRQLQEKQAQAAAAQQRLAATHLAVTAADQSSGPDSQRQRIRVREERIAAEDALAQQQLEVQKLQGQHDAHYRALVADQRARNAEIGWLKGAAAASPADATVQQDARSTQEGIHASDLSLIAAAEKTDPATAAAVRKALLSAPASRVSDTAENRVGSGNPGLQEPDGSPTGTTSEDGPAGFERIPHEDGSHTLRPAGRWTVEDLAKAHERPVFARAAQAERDAVMNDIIGRSFADYSTRPGFDQAAYQRFNQIAQQARDKSASLKTWSDTGADAANFTGNIIGGVARPTIATATDTSFFEPDGEPRVPFGNVAEQAGYWGQKAKDTLHRFLPAGRSAHSKLNSELESLHQDLINGNFPVNDRAKLFDWLAQRSQGLTQSQKNWYEAVQGKPDLNTDKGLTQHIYTHANSLLHPANEGLISKFIQTRDPAVWKELHENLTRTPQRAETDKAQSKSLADSKIVNFMTNHYGGGDYQEHMKSAGDPIEIASNLLPAVRGIRAGKAAAEAAVLAGKATAKSSAAALAKSAAINLGTGSVQTLIDNPDATFADLAQAGKENIATALGLHAAGHAVGKAVGLVTGKGKPVASQPPTSNTDGSQGGTASTTHSTVADQPPGTSATTHGDTPPAGHVTDTHTGEGDTNATTATANSGGTTSTSTSASSTATGNDSHTASSSAQLSSTGTGIPPSTTFTQEIDLARKITGNLDKVQAKRPLNPREQADYDKARNLLDRAAPNPPGTRNTGNPKDLVLAGDGPISQTHDAAADVPPPEPAQPANAVGTTIQGPGTTNPDAPTASAGGPTPPTQTVTVGTTTGLSTSASGGSPPSQSGSGDNTNGPGSATTASPGNTNTISTSPHSGNLASNSLPTVSKSGLEELKGLPSVRGKTKAEIEAELISRGYTSTPAHSGGTVWTKPGNDGITSAVRIDPAVIKKKPKGWADEVPHIHKETVPTSKVDASGNYGWQDATTHNDTGIPSTDKRDTHIPGGH